MPVPYDWRLSPNKLQDRDGLFTAIKAEVEAAVERNGMPAVMVAHSLGAVVALQFFEWLKRYPDWEDWVKRNVIG